MVLSLKAWESRSPPGLPKTRLSHNEIDTKTPRPPAGRFCLPPPPEIYCPTLQPPRPWAKGRSRPNPCQTPNGGIELRRAAPRQSQKQAIPFPTCSGSSRLTAPRQPKAGCGRQTAQGGGRRAAGIRRGGAPRPAAGEGPGRGASGLPRPPRCRTATAPAEAPALSTIRPPNGTHAPLPPKTGAGGAERGAARAWGGGQGQKHRVSSGHSVQKHQALCPPAPSPAAHAAGPQMSILAHATTGQMRGARVLARGA